MMLNKRSQSILEYSVLIIIAVAAFFVSQPYIQRAVQEKYRQGADVMGEGNQYAKGITRAQDSGSSSGYINGTFTPPITPPWDKCPDIQAAYAALLNAIAELEDQILGMETLIADQAKIRQQIRHLEEVELPMLQQQEAEFTATADSCAQQAKAYRDAAILKRSQAQAKEDQAAEIQYCCQNPWEGRCWFVTCDYDLINQLIMEAQWLRQQADADDAQAVPLEAKAARYYGYAANMKASIAKLQEQLVKLKKQLEDLKVYEEAWNALKVRLAEKKAEAQKMLADYPECLNADPDE